MVEKNITINKTFVPIQTEEIIISPTGLIDKFGRHAKSLRISITDRCNLRCRYCMPAEGIDFTQRDELLSFEEIVRIVKIFHKFDLKQVRITGGEPLVRKDAPKLFAMIKQAVPDITLKMTTNGILLEKFLPKLLAAGLEQVNISLDTLDPHKFEELALRDNFADTLQGIKAALASPPLKVRINAVALKNVNESEVLDFVEFAIEHSTTFRFIEWMPFTGNNWFTPEFISAQEIRDIITNNGYTLNSIKPKNVSQTSREYQINDTNGRIGFIASVTESFCSNCDRIRLTADGKLRPCLHSPIEANLKLPMRYGASDDTLINIIKQTFYEKPKEHQDFLDSNYKVPENDRAMIRLGG